MAVDHATGKGVTRLHDRAILGDGTLGNGAEGHVHGLLTQARLG